MKKILLLNLILLLSSISQGQNLTADRLRINVNPSASEALQLQINANNSFLTGNRVSLGAFTASAALKYSFGYLGFNASRDYGTGNWSLHSDGLSNGNNGGCALHSNVDGSLYLANWKTLGSSPRLNINDSQVWDSTKFAFKYNGHLGIATRNPLSQIQIGGVESDLSNSSKFNIGTYVPQSSLGWGIGYIGFNATRTLSGSAYTWQFDKERVASGTANSGGAAILVDIFGRMRFVTMGSQANSNFTRTDDQMINETRLMIDAFGNVVIGSGRCEPSVSAAKLSVNGLIACKEILVKNPNSNGCFPDYVFEKGYNLLSLEETEKFINENKHLPEIPSQKEVDINGLNLYDMNILLLKKVEELTLHIIKLNKKIEANKGKE